MRLFAFAIQRRSILVAAIMLVSAVVVVEVLFIVGNAKSSSSTLATDDPLESVSNPGLLMVPKVDAGMPAPDFSLQDPSRSSRVCLSQFKDKKPVVLIFGSIT